MLIEIPLYIVDKKGNPVKDLKPEEVILYKNGKRQKISHFVLVQNDSPQVASIARKYPSSRRQFLLLFDFAFTAPGKIIKAREACLNFVKEKTFRTDLVAVAAYSGSGLNILSNFSNDREQLHRVIDTLGLVDSKHRIKGPLGFSFPTIAQPSKEPEELAPISPRKMADLRIALLQNKVNKKKSQIYQANVSDFITALDKLSVGLNNIKGRKHIIYFSEGFDIKAVAGLSLTELNKITESFSSSDFVARYIYSFYDDVDTRFGDGALRMNLFNALNKVSSADCIIHTVDIGGLRTQASALTTVDGGVNDVASLRKGQDTLNLFSRTTGGQAFRNINELERPLENLLKITNTYYIIGFYPEDEKKEGKFNKIKIKTTRPDVKISHRKGYYESKLYNKYSSLEKKLQLVEYIVKDLPRSEIQFNSHVSVFRGKEGICQVPVFLKLPASQFLEKKGRIRLEIYGYAISSSGVFKDFFHQNLAIDPGKTKEKLERFGVKYYDLHLLPPGDYKIKLIIRDEKTGKIGSQIQEISVPDYGNGDLAMSGPVFIQTDSNWLLARGYDPQKPSGRKLGVNLPVDYPYVVNNSPFIPGIIPVLERSSRARIYLKVYNLRLHPQAKVPQTEMNFEVIDAEGKNILLKNIGLLKAPAQIESGVFELLFYANFNNLSSGSYQMKLSLKDSMTNQVVVASTPFILQ